MAKKKVEKKPLAEATTDGDKSVEKTDEMISEPLVDITEEEFADAAAELKAEELVELILGFDLRRVKFIAEIAYGGYCKHTGNRDEFGYKLTKWVDLDISIQEAWMASALAILQTDKELNEGTVHRARLAIDTANAIAKKLKSGDPKE